ncbi:MAG: pentapeptide repeat-containing protein [Legionella sp.]|jgi:uncharacterized protein YjbI with pentapeptide repeats
MGSRSFSSGYVPSNSSAANTAAERELTQRREEAERRAKQEQQAQLNELSRLQAERRRLETALVQLIGPPPVVINTTRVKRNREYLNRQLSISPVISDCDFSGEDLRSLPLSDLVFKNCSFRNANLSEVQMRRTDFFNCDLSLVNFQKAYISHANLQNADCSDADFTDTDFNYIQANNATKINGAKGLKLNAELFTKTGTTVESMITAENIRIQEAKQKMDRARNNVQAHTNNSNVSTNNAPTIAVPQSTLAAIPTNALPENIQVLLEDPISLDEYVDPVIARSGVSYSRATMDSIFQQYHGRNPHNRNQTFDRLEDTTPNLGLKEFLQGRRDLLDPVTKKPIITPVFIPGTNGTMFDKATWDDAATRSQIKVLLQLNQDKAPVLNRIMAQIIPAFRLHRDRTVAQIASNVQIQEPVGTTTRSFKSQFEAAKSLVQQNELYSAKTFLYSMITNQHQFVLSMNERFSLYALIAEVHDKLSEFDEAIIQSSQALEYRQEGTEFDSKAVLQEVSCYLRMGDIERKSARTHGDDRYHSAHEHYQRGLSSIENHRANFARQQDKAALDEFCYLWGTLLENDFWAMDSIQNKDMVLAQRQYQERAFAVLDRSTNEFITIVDNQPLVHLMRAKYYFLIKDFAASRVCAERALAIANSLSVGSISTAYKVKIKLQLALALMEQYQPIPTLFQTLVEVAPENNAVKQAHENARVVIEEALADDKVNRALLEKLAKIHLRSGEWDKAIATARLSLRTASDDVPMRLMLAIALQRKAQISQGTVKQNLEDESVAQLYSLSLNNKLAASDLRDVAHCLLALPVAHPDNAVNKLTMALENALKNSAQTQVSLQPTRGNGGWSMPEYNSFSVFFKTSNQTASSSSSSSQHQSNIETQIRSVLSTRIESPQDCLRCYNQLIAYKIYKNGFDNARDRALCDEVITYLQQQWQRQENWKNLDLNVIAKAIETKTPDLKAQPTTNLFTNIEYKRKIFSEPSARLTIRNVFDSEFRSKGYNVLNEFGIVAQTHYTNTHNETIITAIAEFSNKIFTIRAKNESSRTMQDKKDLLDWENDIKEMCLSNPNFPNLNEFYLALDTMEHKTINSFKVPAQRLKQELSKVCGRIGASTEQSLEYYVAKNEQRVLPLDEPFSIQASNSSTQFTAATGTVQRESTKYEYSTRK